ncbi:MAG: type I-F CRISPR-associated helicase Cas3f [Pseudomonadota bacterium]
MMVTFVSQCEKKALNKSRRVLDAFANRIGDRTWQTVITQEGLNAVKKLLRKTASKNTAVSCFWIRSRSRSELVWIVGNRDKFNQQGIVPVNFTDKEVKHYNDKYNFMMLVVMKYAVQIAALFHDFGKATILFQDKLDPEKNTQNWEPFRHEWVSFRLFQAFVYNQTDKKWLNDEQWLKKLSEIEKNNFPECYKDGLDDGNSPQIPDLPHFGQMVAWMILTHHKLPLYPAWKTKIINNPELRYIDRWLKHELNAFWNSHNCHDENEQDRIKQNWVLKDLPTQSIQWRCKASIIASEARVKLRTWINQDINWLHEQLFTTHLSRLCLTLADHYYSAQEETTEEWRNTDYSVYANTHWVDDKKQYKQQLDEHLIGVAHHADKIVQALARLNASLDSLESKNELTENVDTVYKEQFGWQDQARKLTEGIGKESIQNGFFGINMASTGKGKTLANAKIMNALGKTTGRTRFSVALGLRTLTLQTGKEYQQKLKLTDEELAIAVGGTSIKLLFENQQSEKQKQNKEKETGSESAEILTDPDLYLHYKGRVTEHSLYRWTQKDKKLEGLLQAPVLVCTIDHLISATEGTKGGRQIPATLRLLSSDLVLDEPDDFGLDDLPALCRLVHWAGLLGSRILLSTATLPPALTYALFQAYQSGWSHYAKANLENWNGEILCAWFDEELKSKKDFHHGCYKEFPQFEKAHQQFIDKRVKKLEAQPVKRQAKIVKVEQSESSTIKSIAKTIQEQTLQLHQYHSQTCNNKTLSIGLVRMANIKQLVAVAKALLQIPVTKESTHIHYCIYHSSYPLAVRAFIEKQLDRVLNRKNEQEIWQRPEITETISKYPDIQNHIFIVLASPVAEVGRDHDYDWAIVEPSSMRSIIQLAGRILRHRNKLPKYPNIVLLHKNYKALTLNKEKICFERPGFESQELKMTDHDLFSTLEKEQYEKITAIQRIKLPDHYKELSKTNLIALEHHALLNKLFTTTNAAKLWWKNKPQWCGELQRQQRFRNSKTDEPYCLWINDIHSSPTWKWKNEHVKPVEYGEGIIQINPVELKSHAKGNSFWFDQDSLSIYQQLAKDFNWTLEGVSKFFGEIRLIEYENSTQEYNYHPNLGVFQEIEK